MGGKDIEPEHLRRWRALYQALRRLDGVGAAADVDLQQVYAVLADEPAFVGLRAGNPNAIARGKQIYDAILDVIRRLGDPSGLTLPLGDNQRGEQALLCWFIYVTEGIGIKPTGVKVGYSGKGYLELSWRSPEKAVRERMWATEKLTTKGVTLGAWPALWTFVRETEKALGIPLAPLGVEIDAVLAGEDTRGPKATSERSALPMTTYLAACPEGQRHQVTELTQAGTSRPWWEPADGRWYGQLFAFWCKTSHTVDCDRIRLHDSGQRYDAKHFRNVPPRTDKPQDKAAFLSMSSFGTDDEPVIRYAVSNWGMAHWVERNLSAFLVANPQVSLFGLSGRPPVPTIMNVQPVLRTADGYFVLSLRSSERHVAYYPLHWSASFEEGIRPGTDGDRTLGSAIRRGLEEEFCGTDSARTLIQASTCLAVGRDYVREAQRTVAGTSIMVAVQLSCTLEQFWSGLDAERAIPDREEHIAWMGCRFRRREDLLRLLQATRSVDSTLGPGMLRDQLGSAVEIKVYAESDTRIGRAGGFPWMPTSPARLFLASEWFDRRRRRS